MFYFYFDKCRTLNVQLWKRILIFCKWDRMFHFVFKRVSEALKKFYKRLLDLEGNCLIIWKVRFAGNIGPRKSDKNLKLQPNYNSQSLLKSYIIIKQFQSFSRRNIRLGFPEFTTQSCSRNSVRKLCVNYQLIFSNHCIAKRQNFK